MSIPATRKSFKDYCMRGLGWPVIEINVSDEQIDDRLDEALKYYYDYHFDGADKIYYKHIITANNYPDRLYDLTLKAGGTGYHNTDSIVFTSNQLGTQSNSAIVPATGHIVTDANGAITSVVLDTNGFKYQMVPSVNVQSNTGSGANVVTQLGGWIRLPENIIGAVNIFNISSALGAGSGMFSITYQFALNDLWAYMADSLVPYYMAMQHFSLIEQILIGQQPLRFNRHQGKLWLDMAWDKFTPGNFVVVEAYQIVDPEEFPLVWSDRWLYKYTSQLIKKQWAGNIGVYAAMPLPGGLQFNADFIYNQADSEIKALEAEMINTYSLPVFSMVG